MVKASWPWLPYQFTRERQKRRLKQMMNHRAKTPLEKKIADDYCDYLYTYMIYHLDKEELADMLGFKYYQEVMDDVKNGKAQWFWGRGDYGVSLIHDMYQELYEDYSFDIEIFDESRWHKYLHGISPTADPDENPIIINGQCVKPVKFWPWRNKLSWFYQRQQEMKVTKTAEDDEVRQQYMYKIAFLDKNTPSFVTSSTCFLTKDIEDFTKRWLQLETSEERKDRFLRAKAGELISETYDSEESIVEKASYKIYATKSFHLENVYFRSTNFWCCQDYYHVDNWDLDFIWLPMGEGYERMVSYKANGVCSIELFPWRIETVHSYGNKFFECYIPYDTLHNYQAIKNELPNASFDNFAQNSIATIAYQPIRYFRTEEEMLRDIKDFRPSFGVLDVIFDELSGM